MNTTKQLKTINLQGKQYAQVNERIKAFHDLHKTGSIQTEPNLNGEVAFVKAIVIPDTEKPERKFVAHSYGSLRGVKAFEKLETVAVGRALAYLGFSIDGAIASQEEMEEFEQKQEQPQPKPAPELVTQAQLTKLHACISELAELKGKKADEIKDWIKTSVIPQTFKVEIESTKELTKAQASTLIEYLTKLITNLEEEMAGESKQLIMDDIQENDK